MYAQGWVMYAVGAMSMCAQAYFSVNSLRNAAAVIVPP